MAETYHFFPLGYFLIHNKHILYWILLYRIAWYLYKGSVVQILMGINCNLFVHILYSTATDVLHILESTLYVKYSACTFLLDYKTVF